MSAAVRTLAGAHPDRIAAFEDQKIEGLRQFVLDRWMMTANSEFARDQVSAANQSVDDDVLPLYSFI